jgi:hypothetical protein
MRVERENLVLEHLRSMRAMLDEHRTTLSEHGSRLTEIGAAVAGLRRNRAMSLEARAHLAARVDRLRDDVERIKRRLELSDG